MANGGGGARSDGQIVRIWRSVRGYSQLELQNRAGLAKGRVSKIETGEMSPTLDEVRAIADALEVPVTEMIRMGERINEHVAGVLERELASLESPEIDHDLVLRLLQAILDRVGTA